ncbi:MAG: hypothetical protein IKN81_06055 [Oscillospiraceae bacterium]|nr:hypothetical protein [Oscillospiraceae bacterium]
MKNTVRMTFTLDELRELTGICSEHGHHMKAQAIRNGNPKQFDKLVNRSWDFSSRFYNALIKAEYGKAQ